MQLSKVFSLTIILSASNVAYATPCQELAIAFAKDTASMSDIELAKLRTCVTDALKKKLIEPRNRVPPPAMAPPVAPVLAPPRPVPEK